MEFGISGQPVPSNLPYSEVINYVCQKYNFSPCLAYAIAWREVIVLEVNGTIENALTEVSPDGGHGLFQLTETWPVDWEDAASNTQFAVTFYLIPALTFWSQVEGLTGEDLVKCIAAEFNCGRGMALRGHKNGNVNLYTTNNYASGVLANYDKLIIGEHP